MALVLALAIAMGIAGQPSPAQAAPAGTTVIDIWLYAQKVSGEHPVCVGDNGVIAVKVWKKFEIVGVGPSLGTLIGVEVQASVTDSRVVTIHQPNRSTNVNSDPPGIAYFDFSAEKPGTTIIQFSGKLNKRVFLGLVLSQDIVTTEIPVTVVNCDFKVTAVSHWSGFGLEWVAMIDEAGISSDAPGHYTGTAVVNWVVTETHPRAGCSPHVVTSTSQADLTGEMDRDGQRLGVDVAYRLAENTWYTILDDCTTHSSVQLISHTPDPLTFSLPSSGGGSTQSQALVDQFPALNLSGSANFAVIPVTNP